MSDAIGVEQSKTPRTATVGHAPQQREPTRGARPGNVVIAEGVCSATLDRGRPPHDARARTGAAAAGRNAPVPDSFPRRRPNSPPAAGRSPHAGRRGLPAARVSVSIGPRPATLRKPGRRRRLPAKSAPRRGILAAHHGSRTARRDVTSAPSDDSQMPRPIRADMSNAPSDDRIGSADRDSQDATAKPTTELNCR